jgi:hypothetical protein
MDNFTMPQSFPMAEFRAFGIAASSFMGSLISDENLFDPQEKRRNFDWAWQAVRYRYRTCVERADEFTGLLFAPSGIAWPNSSAWLAGGGDALQPGDFPHVAAPRKINLAVTIDAFEATFSSAAITSCLADLVQKPEFIRLDKIRNVLAHRLSGRRSIRQETWSWHIPDLPDALEFSTDMLHRLMDEITGMLTTLIAAAREFAESQQSATGKEAMNPAH